MSASTRADLIRAQERRRQEQRAATEAQPAEQPRATARPVRTRDVRRTVDLSPQQHKDLSAWCDEAAEELGLTRVTGQDVLVTLVGQLLADDALAQTVRDHVADEVRRRQLAKSKT